MSKSIPPYQRFGRQSFQSEARLRTHLFVGGESLDLLAHRYWHDRRFWRELAQRNGVTDPRRIEPGTLLVIPDAPVEEGYFDSL